MNSNIDEGFGYIGASNPDDLYNLIDSLNGVDLNATIFTYSIGNDVSDEIPRQISCIGNGVWTKV